MGKFQKSFFMFLKFFSKIVRSTDSLWFHFTKKTNKRCKLFIPTDVSKEIELFKREIEHSNERAFILKGHVWSENFRKWMIENKMFELAFDIESDAEMVSLFAFKAPRPIMVKVLKEHTPSRKVLDNLCYTDEYVQQLFCDIPEAFKSVSCEKIIDIKEHVEVLIDWGVKNNEKYLLHGYFNYILSNKKPYDYLLPKMLRVIANHDSYRRGISDWIPDLKEYFPTTYRWVRENIDVLRDKERIISKAFEPQNLPKGIDIKNIEDINITGDLDVKADALAWLRIAYDYACRNEVFDILLNAFGYIKQVNAGIYSQICEKMCGSTKANDTSFAEQVEPVYKLRLVYQWHTYSFLEKYFPFLDWPENLQKSAIRIMVKRNMLECKMLGQLSDELKKYALERLEIEAQLATVEKGNLNDVKALCSSKRDSEVEVAVARLTNVGYRDDLNRQEACQAAVVAKNYLLNFDISSQAFMQYIKITCDENIREYIEHKKGLTQSEYEVLITSRFSYLAANAKIKQDN